jgi:chromosome segregation ATPase
MFFARDTKKTSQVLEDLKNDVAGVKEGLDTRASRIEGKLADIENTLGELKEYLEDKSRSQEADKAQGPGDAGRGHLEKDLEEIRKEVAGLGEGLMDVRQRAEGINERVVTIQGWTGTVKKEFKTVKDAIADATTDIKNKISYVVFRLKT